MTRREAALAAVEFWCDLLESDRRYLSFCLTLANEDELCGFVLSDLMEAEDISQSTSIRVIRSNRYYVERFKRGTRHGPSQYRVHFNRILEAVGCKVLGSKIFHACEPWDPDHLLEEIRQKHSDHEHQKRMLGVMLGVGTRKS